MAMPESEGEPHLPISCGAGSLLAANVADYHRSQQRSGHHVGGRTRRAATHTGRPTTGVASAQTDHLLDRSSAAVRARASVESRRHSVAGSTHVHHSACQGFFAAISAANHGQATGVDLTNIGAAAAHPQSASATPGARTQSACQNAQGARRVSARYGIETSITTEKVR